MKRFVVTSEGADRLGLREILQRYADEFWLRSHLKADSAGPHILEHFRRAVEAEIKLLAIRCEPTNGK